MLIVVRWHLVVLICVSLVISDGQHLFYVSCTLGYLFEEMSTRILLPIF